MDDGAPDVPVRSKTPKESPSHSFHERTLARLLSGSRHGEGRHSQVTVAKTENPVDRGDNVGDTEVGLKDVKEKRKFERESFESEMLAVSSSVDDIGLERGRSEDTNVRRSPATFSMKRSKSVDSRSGERSIRANFKNKNATEPSENREGTDNGGGKKEREIWAGSREDGKSKKGSDRESKSTGDARAEQGGSLMSKLIHPKDASQKSRLARSGSGGGIMKTIGGITAAGRVVPPNSSVSAEEVNSKLKASSSRIEIVAFEIANIIVRVLNLRNSLRPNDIQELKKEVLSSEGVRQLVSEDELDLWCIAAEDKRMELQSVAKEVARLGALCPESTYRFLAHEFNMLGTVEEPKPKRSPEEVEQELKYLESQAQVTSELYHELISLKSLEQTYQKKSHGLDKVDDKDEKKGASHLKDPLALMKNEVKTQEKNVKLLKKKCLWNKGVDVVVERLVEVIIYLHQLIVSVFGAQVVKVGGLMDRPRESPTDLQKLGVSGLAIHYANIINVIDNLAMRPFAATQLRDTLYHMLSPSLRRQLKKALMKSGNMEQEDTDAIMERMESVLDWLVTMGANTVRYSAERRLQGHTELTLLQTLYHANQGRTESLMVELLVSLNHVASRHRRQGEPERSPIPHAPIIAPIPEEKESESEVGNDRNNGREGGKGAVRGNPPGRLADLTPEDQKEDEDDDDDLGEEWRTRESRGEGGDFDRIRVADPYAMFGPEEKNMFVPPMPMSEPPKTLPGTIGENPIPRSLSRHSLSLSKGSYSEIDLHDLPSPSRPSKLITAEMTFHDILSADVVPPRTPPSIVAYRKLYASLSEEERMKIEGLAKGGVEAPPGISKSLEFKRVGGIMVAQGLNGRVYTTGGLVKSPLAYEASFLSPRSQSFSFSRSLSRSNSSTPSLGGEGSSRPSRVRAMTPPAVDVDALGDGGHLD